MVHSLKEKPINFAKPKRSRGIIFEIVLISTILCTFEVFRIASTKFSDICDFWQSHETKFICKY